MIFSIREEENYETGFYGHHKRVENNFVTGIFKKYNVEITTFCKHKKIIKENKAILYNCDISSICNYRTKRTNHIGIIWIHYD